MSEVPSWMFEGLWIHFWHGLTHAINCFPIHEWTKQFWRHQICKHYQNITGRLVFMIMFGIHCNVFIVLPIRLKTCRTNGFLFFNKAKRAHPKNWARLRGFARPCAPDADLKTDLDLWTDFTYFFGIFLLTLNK